MKELPELDVTKEDINEYEDIEPIKRKKSLYKQVKRKKTKDFGYSIHIFNFISKFYTILLIQHLLTFFFIFICLKSKTLYEFVKNAKFIFLAVFVIAMLITLGSFIFEELFEDNQTTSIILLVFTILNVYSTTYVSLKIDNYTLMMSTLSVALILITLLFYVATNRENIKLSIGIFIIIGCALFHYFFYEAFMKAVRGRIIFSMIWVLFCGFYLIGWTKYFIIKRLKYQRSDDHILFSFRYYIIIFFFLSLFYASKYQYLSFFDIIINN